MSSAKGHCPTRVRLGEAVARSGLVDSGSAIDPDGIVFAKMFFVNTSLMRTPAVELYVSIRDATARTLGTMLEWKAPNIRCTVTSIGY